MKIGIVDDQALMLKGLSMIIGMTPGYEVSWTAENGEIAIAEYKNNPVDVILMDIRMPIMDGIETAKAIKGISAEVKIVMLTTFDEPDLIHKSLALGVSGFILKESQPEQIIDAINAAYEGGVAITPSVAAKIMPYFETMTPPKEQLEKRNALTEREWEIVTYVSEGLSNKEIADIMFLSEGTIKNHMTHILSKLDLRDRTQLAIWFLK